MSFYLFPPLSICFRRLLVLSIAQCFVDSPVLLIAAQPQRSRGDSCKSRLMYLVGPLYKEVLFPFVLTSFPFLFTQQLVSTPACKLQVEYNSLYLSLPLCRGLDSPSRLLRDHAPNRPSVRLVLDPALCP